MSASSSAAFNPAAGPRFCCAGGLGELPADMLGAIVYGREARAECVQAGDPRLAAVPLEAMPGAPRVETWITQGPVTSGTMQDIHYTSSAKHLFGFLEVDEAAAGGLRAATRGAYRQMLRFHSRRAHSCIWRIWNFIDAINEGEGDAERYRQFCLGRAEGMADHVDVYPAGTAVGTRTGQRRLQVVWLAGRGPGRPIENPRQVSAYRYPRQYGPASPSFSRAMHLEGQLLISGTSSIVGHETVHGDDISAQLRESVSNLRLVAGAAAMDPDLLTGLKAYVRHGADLGRVAAELSGGCFAGKGVCVLSADICRSELLIELEAVVQCPPAPAVSEPSRYAGGT